MSDIEIKLGQSKVILTRSDELVALRPRAGRTMSFENEVRSLEARGRGALRGRVAGFDIVELPSSPARHKSAREDLGRMMSMDRQTAVYHTSDDLVPFVPMGTIYLSFAEGVAQEDADGVLRRHSLTVLKAERDGYFTVRAPTDPVELCVKLQAEPAVAVAEPDLATPMQPAQFLLPGDQLLGELWHLRNIGKHGGNTLGYKAGADARVVDAWAALGGLGARNVIIGIIDDGFDLAHPDLRDKAVLPWNFVTNSPDVTPGVPVNGNDDWHGTACAGVAAGMSGAGDMIGVAPNARIMPVRMGVDVEPEPLAKMFEYMAMSGAWVVNCSWGPRAAKYALGDRLFNAITFCAKQGRGGLGTLVLFAAGNSNTSINDQFHHNGLATHPLVIAVASSTSLDQRDDNSNFGAEIAVCAPSSGGGGWAIITSDVTGSYADANGVVRYRGYGPGDYYRQFGGTSSACALVSGVCALVLSAAPALSADQLRAILQRTARRIGPPEAYDPTGHSIHFGFGCVNAAAAVAAARTQVLTS
ncbi:S8 family serine peptidase [Mesorhizobium sp. M0621]|uniref:S8 family serine peptidase n=1 Tax=unclassified Mesorhizobium TaxID=325217 RepID=UPI003334C7BB